MSRAPKGGEAFAGLSDEKLRARVAAVRAEQRRLRQANNGGGLFREDAIARVDELERSTRERYATLLERFAVEGDPRPIGLAGPTIGGVARELFTLHAAFSGGFFDELRRTVAESEAFSGLSRQEMQSLLAPSEQEADRLLAELARRHQEREALRDRLGQLDELTVG